MGLRALEGDDRHRWARQSGAGAAELLGLAALSPEVDLKALASRVHEVEQRLAASATSQLESQGVRIVRGTARLAGPHRVEVAVADAPDERLEADAVLLATGSSPRLPDWAEVDGERVLSHGRPTRRRSSPSTSSSSGRA